MYTQQRLVKETKSVHRFSTLLRLADGATTTVHVVRYNRETFKTRVIAFARETYLVDWCKQNNEAEAVVGGFFLRSSGKLVGDTWIDGVQYPSTPVIKPWNEVRGCVYIDANGDVSLGPRNLFPIRPSSLLQAGPTLVHGGISQIIDGFDKEGISECSQQFDNHITIGRYPRAAIGVNDKYIWSVVCDGRSSLDAGMTLQELAETMLKLGAHDALNMDGGSSASQISDGILRNRSRGDDREFPKGRPIHSAVVFEEY